MDEWAKFLALSLSKRLDADRFAKYTQLLNNKHPLQPRRIADILFRPSKHSTQCFDPLIPHYVQASLYSDLLDLPAVLQALLKYSKFNPDRVSRPGAEEHEDVLKWSRPYIQAEGVIYGLVKIVQGGLRPKNAQEAVQLVAALTEWTKVLAIVGPADDMMHDTHMTELLGVRVALGTLLFATSENIKVLGVLGRSCPKDNLRAFSQSLATFTSLLLHNAPVIAQKLELFRTQTLVPLDPIEEKRKAANDEIDQMIDSSMAMGAMGAMGIDSVLVVDLPSVNSRAGLYIYLHSLLVGRPLIDDDTIFNYLHNRYQGDIQTTSIDLILASFDVLANAIFRSENAQATMLLRSFLINKVPLLLEALSHSMFPPLSPEYCIAQALSQVDTNAFPSLSSMFDESSSGNMFGDSVRQDFCFACCLHDLIPEESIEGLLGEIPMQTLPAGGRYAKEDLVQQCITEPDRAERFLEELDRMDGNVGAVSQAVVEVMRQYCATKETMSLKTLCSNLARQPSSMDVLLLFEKPTAILHPICELLDGWQYEEDQGEYQPVYEEFGSILLLVLAFVHRYNLSPVDLGLHNSNSFISRLLVKGAISYSMDELSEQEKSHLDGWIRALFNSAEGGGLGDEPMSNCPPQDFYLLVPTLFHQVVLAYSTGYLSDEALKGGLDYLVDTFLLPSLVGAINWLADHLWESRGDSNTVIQILQTLINPGSISSDANEMLSCILNIVAKPLEHSLRWLQRSEPTRQDVEPLSKVLKPHLLFSRTAASDHTELESWTNSSSGGMAANIRHTIQLLTQWSFNPALNVMPTSYTHRQILSGFRLLGAKRLLSAIFEEVKAQTSNGNGAIVIDIATAIICAPDADTATPDAHLLQILDDNPSTAQPPQRRLTLRDALRTEAEAAPKTHKTDVLHAETVIRLFRRVEALMAPPMQPAALLDHGLGVGAGLDVDGLGDGVLSGGQAINDAIVAAAAADQDMMDMIVDDNLFAM